MFKAIKKVVSIVGAVLEFPETVSKLEARLVGSEKQLCRKVVELTNELSKVCIERDQFQVALSITEADRDGNSDACDRMSAKLEEQAIGFEAERFKFNRSIEVKLGEVRDLKRDITSTELLLRDTNRCRAIDKATLSAQLELERFIGDEVWEWAKEKITALETECDARQLVIDGLKKPTPVTSVVEQAKAEVAVVAAVNSHAPPGVPPAFTYESKTECFGERIRVIIIRNDGLRAMSTWWGVDDGSAQAEAWERMGEFEREEERGPQECTCHLSPPCNYCVTRPEE